MDRKSEFLYASISDIQLTIRSIDIKSGFLFVLLFSPMVFLEKYHEIYKATLEFSDFLKLLYAIDIVLWIFSVFFTFMVILAINDPSEYIPGANGLGQFYEKNLFPINILDVFVNRRNSAKMTLQQQISALPQEEENIIAELVFEKMKLTYIQSLKIKRSIYSVLFSKCWFLLSIFILLYSVFC